VNAGYQGSTHSDIDASSLAWRVANKARKLKLQTKLTNRYVSTPKLITDLRNMGRQKFESASLATFNKKIQDLKAGRLVEGETDDIATPNFQITAMDNSD